MSISDNYIVLALELAQDRVRVWSSLEPSELSTAHDAIAQSRRRLAALNSSAIVTEQDQKERDGLEYQLQCFGSLLAPIRRLPNHILLIIFSLCISETSISIDTDSGEISMSIPGATLEEVCSPWNALISDMPSLWSNIRVDLLFLDIANPTVYGRLDEILQGLLKKSRNRPLCIDVSYMGDWPVEALASLLRESYRWKRLSSYADDSVSDKDSALQKLKSDFPLLEWVGMRGNTDGTCSWFRNAPRLRTCSLNSHYSPMFKLPWGQLTSVDLDVDEERLIEILPKLTSLERLTVTCNFTIDFNAREKIKNEDLVLPLSSLKTICRDRDCKLLKYWSFPNISQLEVTKTDDADFCNTPTTLINNIQRLIVKMSWHHKFPMAFFESSVCYPALTNLVIIGKDGTSGVLGSLGEQKNLAYLVERFPRLEKITVSLNKTIYGADVGDTSFNVWIDLIEAFVLFASAKDVFRLSDVELALPVSFQESLKPRLVNLRSRGVYIRVYEGTERRRVMF
jgi:hypothetical protein